MGAGAITSNVKSDKTLVKVHAEDKDLETGFKKFGAILGDGAEIGCNSVLNPGTVIGRNSIVDVYKRQLLSYLYQPFFFLEDWAHKNYITLGKRCV